jgi:uncharacterized membrane protein
VKECCGTELQQEDGMSEEERNMETPEVPEMPAVPPLSDSESALTTGVTSSSDDRLLGGLIWLSMVLLQLPLLSVVLLLIEPNKHNRFQRYHSVSSLIFWAAALIYEGLATIVFAVLSIISLGCLAICGWVIFFVPHALALYYALKAYHGEEVQIPFVTDFARRQGWI